MSDRATFTADWDPFGGDDPRLAIRQVVSALSTPTVGDMLYIGQLFRSGIRERTFAGIDADGQPFAPYSTRRYYFYPNREVGSVRPPASGRIQPGGAGSSQVRAARRTAAKGRYSKTDRVGTRTPFGIRYDGGYAEAKAAHGRANVDLYGLEQHTHMLDVMLVKAGQWALQEDVLEGDAVATANREVQPANDLELGFYGPEAGRAEGNNEGTGRGGVKREFFKLSEQDLLIGETALAERMMWRARAGGPSV